MNDKMRDEGMFDLVAVSRLTAEKVEELYAKNKELEQQFRNAYRGDAYQSTLAATMETLQALYRLAVDDGVDSEVLKPVIDEKVLYTETRINMMLRAYQTAAKALLQDGKTDVLSVMMEAINEVSMLKLLNKSKENAQELIFRAVTCTRNGEDFQIAATIPAGMTDDEKNQYEIPIEVRTSLVEMKELYKRMGLHFKLERVKMSEEVTAVKQEAEARLQAIAQEMSKVIPEELINALLNAESFEEATSGKVMVISAMTGMESVLFGQSENIAEAIGSQLTAELYIEKMLEAELQLTHEALNLATVFAAGVCIHVVSDESQFPDGAIPVGGDFPFELLGGLGDADEDCFGIFGGSFGMPS